MTRIEKRDPKRKEIRTAAIAICRVATNYNCVMDDLPVRTKCNQSNCRVMKIARKAIKEAQAA